MPDSIAPDLRAWLASHNPVVTERVVWAFGTMTFDGSLFLTTDDPPLHLVSSARCVVLQDNTVLCLTNAEARHILPGGRIEAGETPRQTVCREV